MISRSTTRTALPAVVVVGVAAVGLGVGWARSDPAPATPASSVAAPGAAAPPSDAAPEVGQGPAGLVRVDLVWAEQRGHASNQLAVWIEDATGRHVRSLFATSFTAEGGWVRRPMSLPAWRAAAGWDDPPVGRLEAVSRPAPDSGPLSLYWDGLDETGTPAPPGTYRVRVEANLRWENRVEFTGELTVGDQPASVAPAPVFAPAPVPEQGLVTAVRAEYLPGERLDPTRLTTYTRGS